MPTTPRSSRSKSLAPIKQAETWIGGVQAAAELLAADFHLSSRGSFHPPIHSVTLEKPTESERRTGKPDTRRHCHKWKDEDYPVDSHYIVHVEAAPSVQNLPLRHNLPWLFFRSFNFLFGVCCFLLRKLRSC